MSFITTNLGDVLLLKYMLNNTTPTNPRLHLYTNNITPSTSDVLSLYTESVATGYSVKELGGTFWTFATVSGTSTASYATQTFSYSTTDTLYGYYLTDQSVATLIWAEKFSGGPFTLPSGGGTITISPVIQLQ
jgi:hypothetical protein